MEEKFGGRMAAGFMVTVPIFEGNRISADIENAKLESEKAAIQEKKAENELSVLYKGTLDRIESLKEGLSGRKNGIEQAKKSAEASLTAYKNGAAAHSEVADAELLLLKMEVDRLRIITELLIYLARWEHLSGLQSGAFPKVN
jgi:outer membrane protein TolC